MKGKHMTLTTLGKIIVGILGATLAIWLVTFLHAHTAIDTCGQGDEGWICTTKWK